MPERVAFVADSTADLGRDEAAELGVRLVPLKVIFGDDILADGVDIDPSGFFERMAASPVHPRTSQPSPEEFEAAFRDAGESAGTVVCSTISAELSGSLNAARTAREGLPHLDIRLIDTRTAGPGHNAVLRAGLLAAAGGQDAEGVIDAMERVLETQRLVFTVETLEYLRRGGRIGGARALLGSVLNIKPVLDVQAGRVAALDRVRTLERALDRLLEELRVASGSWGGRARVIIGHAARPEQAARLAERARRYSDGDPRVMFIGPVIGCHVGPGAFGLSFHRPL